MKFVRIFIVFFSFQILLTIGVSAQIEFKEIESAADWDTIINRAQVENKMIFIDIYATWCGPCKMLEREVYPDVELGKYYNENFINIKLDGETEFGRTKAIQYALKAYPSMFFLSRNDEIIASIVGLHRAPELISFGEKVVGNSEKMLGLSKSFENGELDAKGLMSYRQLLLELGSDAKAGEVADKILPTLTVDEVLDPSFKDIIAGSSSDLDGKIFSVIKNNREKFNEIYSQEELAKLFSNIYDASLRRAIGLKSEKYRNRIIDEFLPVYFPSNPDALKQGTYITYKLYDANTGNWDGFEKRVLDHYNTGLVGDDKFLYSESYEIVNNYSQIPQALTIAGKLIEKAVLLNPSFDNLVMQSYVFGVTGQFEQARQLFTRIEAMELTEEQKNIVNELKNIVIQSEDKQ